MKSLVLSMLLLGGVGVQAQQNTIFPDLSKIQDSNMWHAHNRNVHYENKYVHLDSQPGDGMVWLKDLDFENGTIELDIRGKDVQGSSFVGLAFHGVNDSTFDAVYFRPFNFKNPERKAHSVQYISHPKYTWFSLRKDYPGKYEHPVHPVPNPEEWFHATIVVKYPAVKVFVNNAREPSLEVDQLNSRKSGWIGFWVGNYSDGDFKDLKIMGAK